MSATHETTDRDGCSLSDGTHLHDLFDLERRQLSARVFFDPEIYELEMARIFARSWLFVGFESEIPEPGDYVVRPMGGDSVIVTRGKDAAISILLNRCAHRGVQLCVTDCGSANQLHCPYHGWTYGLDGRLLAIPSHRYWIGGKKSEYGLRSARVATRGGLIFGTWRQDMPDFETYLGDFAFYFDSVFCAVDKNLVAIGPPQRWALPFDWKIGTENSLGDGYHLQATHKSLADIGMLPQLAQSLEGIIGADPRWGHGFLAPMAAERPSLEAALHWLPATVLPEIDRHLSPEQLTLLRNGTATNIATIFPNTTWSMAPGLFFFVRTWQPVAPGQIEIWTWTLSHPDASEEQKRARDRGLNLTFGPTGMFGQDDMVVFSRGQRGARGTVASHEFMNYGYSNGAPDKRGYLSEDGEWPGPGDVWIGFPGDDQIWNFYLRWLHLMTGGDL
ncbi:aromatic ring-hydroxylating oxygenase subunit alpha [Mycobacterium sp.]|uniref:aromatic ring-hydroxylating oxygenase subunit alpha n=1 Tax=Mycobacterium sp. TaxID=1785 RepID=UPI003C716D7F